MIACITLPFFAAAVEQRDNQQLAAASLVLGGQPWETRPAYAYCRQAAQRGIRPGMALRHAHLLAPHSLFLPSTETRYSHAFGEVVDFLTDFTPLMEPEALWQATAPLPPFTSRTRSLPARYLLDLESLPEKSALPLVRHIGQSLRQETALHPAIGLAEHKFAAQIAATLARPDHLLPVSPGAELDFLAERSIQYLPLPMEMARRLEWLGVRTLGQFGKMSLSALKTQFGTGIDPFYRLVHGENIEPLRAHQPAPEAQASYTLETPIGNWQTIQALLAQLAAALAHRLEQAGQMGRAITLRWEGESGAVTAHRQQLRQPVAASARIQQVVEDLCRQHPLTEPVAAIAIHMSELAPAAAQQLTLFGPARAALPDLSPIAEKHQTTFWQPHLLQVDHILPEQRFQLAAWQSGLSA